MVQQLFWGTAEQLLFSMVPSIMKFNVDLIFGPYLSFWGPKLKVSGSQVANIEHLFSKYSDICFI